jgi:hypothetical protein
MDYAAADRGGPSYADAHDEARGAGLDSNLSGQAGHKEAGGNTHGKRIMFEVGGTSREVAIEALTLASHKLPIRTKISMRPDFDVTKATEQAKQRNEDKKEDNHEQKDGGPQKLLD